jgi:hypothetical protein
MPYANDQVLFNSGSSGTGPAVFVGDCRLLTLSVQTSTGSASRFTISGSNANGFAEAIPGASWSVMTTILSAGIYTIDPGARWVRGEQPNFSLSATSACTALLNRYYA